MFSASRLFISPQPDFIWRFGLEPGGEEGPSKNAFILNPQPWLLLLPSQRVGSRWQGRKGLRLELGKDEDGQVTGTCVPFMVNICMYLCMCVCTSLKVHERAYTRHSTSVGACLISITDVCERRLQLYIVV